MRARTVLSLEQAVSKMNLRASKYQTMRKYNMIQYDFFIFWKMIEYDNMLRKYERWES